MSSIITIAKAWIKAAKPTEQEKIIAEKRLAICNQCPHKIKPLRVSVCEVCYCPLKAKIFGDNTCPLEKWDK